jgi:hypothetical protein
MTAALNHTVVHATHASASARFLTVILGLPDPVRAYHFEVVELGNGVLCQRHEGPGQRR